MSDVESDLPFIPIEMLRTIYSHCTLLEHIILSFTCKNMNEKLKFKEGILKGFLSACVHHQYLDLIKFGIENGYKIDNVCMAKAVFNGNLEIVKYLRSNGGEFPKDTLKHPLQQNNKELFLYLIENKPEMNETDYFHAIANNSVDVLEELFKMKYPKPERSLINCAASHGKLGSFLMCKKYGEKYDYDTFKCAVEGENLDILNILMQGEKYPDNEKRADQYYYLIAIQKNNLELIKWLYDNYFYISGLGPTTIGKIRNMDILKYLYEKRVLCVNCDSFVSSGDLSIIKWLRSIGNHWGWECYSNTSDIKMWKWLYKNGCPVDNNYFDDLFRKHKEISLSVVKWLFKHDFKFDKYHSILAVRHEVLDVFKLFRERGAPWNKKKCLLNSAEDSEVNMWIRYNC